MEARVSPLVSVLAATVLVGCGGAARLDPGPLDPLPVRPEAAAAVRIDFSVSGSLGLGGYGYGPSYGGPIDGGLALSAFVMPYVEPHGDANFLDAGSGWGIEAGIYTGEQPGSAFVSIARADLDDPAAGVETPYWIVDAGIRVAMSESMALRRSPIVGVWGSGFSYHRFARPLTDDLWGIGAFVLLGAAWLPTPNFYAGADFRAHLWFPEVGQGGTTFVATVGATVLF